MIIKLLEAFQRETVLTISIEQGLTTLASKTKNDRIVKQLTEVENKP